MGLPGSPGSGTPIVAPCFCSCSSVRVKLFTWAQESIMDSRYKYYSYLCPVHLGKLLEVVELLTLLVQPELNLPDVAPVQEMSELNFTKIFSHLRSFLVFSSWPTSRLSSVSLRLSQSSSMSGSGCDLSFWTNQR